MEELIINTFKNASIETACQKFLKLFADKQPTENDLDPILSVLKKTIRYELKNALSQAEQIWVCKVVAFSCSAIEKFGTYLQFLSISKHIYRFIKELSEHGFSDASISTCESFYSMMINSTWWLTSKRDYVFEDEPFVNITKNLHQLFWEAAKNSSQKSELVLPFCQSAIKMLLVHKNGDCYPCHQRLKEIFIFINNGFQKGYNQKLFNEIEECVQKIIITCSESCLRRQKLLEFYIVIFDLCVVSKLQNSLLQLNIWSGHKESVNLVLDDNWSSSNCSICGYSKERKTLCYTIMDLIILSIELLNKRSKKVELKDITTKTLQGYIDNFEKGKSLFSEVPFQANLLLMFAFSLSDSSDNWKIGLEQCSSLKSGIYWIFLILHQVRQSSENADVNYYYVIKLFHKYSTSIAINIVKGFSSEYLVGFSKVLNFGMTTLLETSANQYLHQAIILYGISVNCFKKSMVSAAHLYSEIFWKAINVYINKCSVVELLQYAKEKNIKILEICIFFQDCCLEMGQNFYEEAMNACATWVFYFGLHSNLGFKQWLRIKSFLLKQQSQNETLINRSIIDHLTIIKNDVPGETQIKLLQAEMSFNATRSGDSNQRFTNYAAVSLINHPAVSKVDKAVAQLIICLSVTTKGKPTDWDYVAVCKGALDVLEEISNANETLRIQMAMGYFSLYKYSADTLKEQIYKEELERQVAKKPITKPKGDEEIPDRCDIAATYNHFNLVSEISLRKHLQKFSTILDEILKDSKINWNNLELYYRNAVMDMAGTATDIFSSAGMVTESVKTIGSLLQLSHLLEHENYFVEAALKLMELLNEFNMPSLALTFDSFIGEKIKALSPNNPFTINLFLLLKSDIYFNLGKLEKGLSYLSQVLRKIYKLSDLESNEIFWIIIQSKAFLLLFKYKKVTSKASFPPNTVEVHKEEYQYFSLSPAIILTKGLAKIKEARANEVLFLYSRLPDNLHLDMKYYCKNLLYKILLECGRNCVDFGASRNARTHLQECLFLSKVHLKTIIAANSLLELAFLDILTNLRIDCDIKVEGMFYLLTHSKVEPMINVNGPKPVATSSPVLDTDNFTVSVVKLLDDQDMPDYENDIFLDDWQKMKLRKAKLPYFFRHNSLCACNICAIAEVELIYLKGLMINAQSLIVEKKYCEALSLLQIIEINTGYILQKEQERSKEIQAQVSSIMEKCRFYKFSSIIGTCKNSLCTINIMTFKIIVQDMFAECYSAMGQFDNAEIALTQAECLLEKDVCEQRVLLPQIETRLFYRKALVSFNTICQRKKIDIEDFFPTAYRTSFPAKNIPNLPLSPVFIDQETIFPAATPQKATNTTPAPSVKNAPKKKKPQFLKNMKLSEIDIREPEEIKPKNVLKENNFRTTETIFISSDSTTSPESSNEKHFKKPGKPKKIVTKNASSIKIKSSKYKKIEFLGSSSPISNSSKTSNSAASVSSTTRPTISSCPKIPYESVVCKRTTRQNVKATSTKNENKPPPSYGFPKNVEDTKRKYKTTLSEAAFDLPLNSESSASSSDEAAWKPKSTTTVFKTKLPSKITRQTREVIRSDESSPPNGGASNPKILNICENMSEMQLHDDMKHRNENPAAFEVFEDNILALENILPQNTLFKILKDTEILLWKAKMTSHHYMDWFSHRAVHFLLGLIYNELKEFSKAGYCIGNSVGSSLHQSWIEILQSPNGKEQGEKVYEKQLDGVKEKSLHEEVYGSNNESQLIDCRFLPSDWTVVQINVLDIGPMTYSGDFSRTPSLVITRYRKEEEPVIRIVKSTDEQFQLTFWKNFKNLFVRNQISLRKINPSKWWEERHNLDKLLQHHCAEMESHWLKHLKSIMVGKAVSMETRDRAHIFYMELLSECKKLEIICIDQVLLQAVLEAGHIFTEDDCKNIAGVLFHCSNVQDQLHISTLLYSYIQEIGDCERHPIILILDKHLHWIPWESMPFLGCRSVFRIPSLTILKTQLLSYHFQPCCLKNEGLDASKGCAILNPDGSLPNSEKYITTFIEKSKWFVIKSRAPTPEEMVKAVSCFDIYLFVGHGSGNIFFQKEQVQRKKCKAAVVLMGCSSGKLVGSGCLEPAGVVQNLHIGGCPIIIANLWDVTDVDIDKFTINMLDKWLFNSNTLEGNAELGEAISTGRNSCKLKYLNGSAPVVYGIPIVISKRL